MNIYSIKPATYQQILNSLKKILRENAMIKYQYYILKEKAYFLNKEILFII